MFQQHAFHGVVHTHPARVSPYIFGTHDSLPLPTSSKRLQRKLRPCHQQPEGMEALVSMVPDSADSTKWATTQSMLLVTKRKITSWALPDEEDAILAPCGQAEDKTLALLKKRKIRSLLLVTTRKITSWALQNKRKIRSWLPVGERKMSSWRFLKAEKRSWLRGLS